MMEKALMCERHNHAVFVAGIYNIVVADRTARLCYIRNTAAMCSFDIVTEGEECI